MNSLLEGLKGVGNELIQLESLIEVCDLLSISTEETLSSNFPLDSFVPAMVDLLKMDHNAEMMLMACRALTYLIEGFYCIIIIFFI
jgi:E3 ubiquitin-protein ligase TRIP12